MTDRDEVDLDRHDRTSSAERANMLSGCGTSADRSTTARSLSGWSGCTPCGSRSTVEWLAVRTANSGEPAQVSDFTTATYFPPVCWPLIIGASVATYTCVSSGS